MKLNVMFVPVIMIMLLLVGHRAYAAATETDGQPLKQDAINEIKAYDRQKSVQKQGLLKRQAAPLQNRMQKQLRPVSTARDRIYGNAGALISVVEFSDFECPYCRKIQPVLKRLVDDSKGKVNWVFRHFPLSAHKPNAQQEAEAAECAGHLAGRQGFWKFTEVLFQQPRRGTPDRLAIIAKAVEQAGVDKAGWQDCLKRSKFKDKVTADEAEALSLGLQGTPASVLVNHKTGQLVFRQGAASLDTFLADVQQLLGE